MLTGSDTCRATLNGQTGADVSVRCTSELPNIRIKSTDAAGQETDKLPRVGGGLGTLNLSVEELDGQSLAGYAYRWSEPISTSAVATTAVSTTLVARRIGEYKVTLTNGLDTLVAYTTIRATPCRKITQSYNCGMAPAIPIPDANSLPLASLAPGDTIRTGDFDVVVTEVQEVSNGVFTGTGYVEIPYLKVAKIAVEFKGASVNECYEYTGGGSVITKYDPSWSNVVDVGQVSAKLIDDYVALQTEVLELLATYSGSAQDRNRINEKIAQINSFRDDLSATAIDDSLKLALNEESSGLTAFAACSIDSSLNNPGGRSAACTFVPWAALAKCLGAAALDVWLSYTFKWLELIVDGTPVEYNNFRGITSRMNWAEVTSSALVSCAFSLIPFPTTKGAILVVAGGATLASAQAFATDLITQSNQLSGQQLSLKQAYDKLKWDQAFSAAQRAGVTAAISIAAVKLATHPSVRSFIGKVVTKIATRGREWVRKALKSAVALTDREIDDIFATAQQVTAPKIFLVTTKTIIKNIDDAFKSGDIGKQNEGYVGKFLLENNIYIKVFAQKYYKPTREVLYEVDFELDKFYIEAKRNLNSVDRRKTIEQIVRLFQNSTSKDGKKIVIFSSTKVNNALSSIQEIRTKLNQEIGSDKYIIIDDEMSLLNLIDN